MLTRATQALQKQKSRFDEYKLTRGTLSEDMMAAQQEATQSYERLNNAVEM